ncbi:MAG: cupredoxin domain-containing protein [Deltaproteobacteria bacterium]|nr:cupredoxin domain-containing protein [Deltaproteobacteria bacterium]
MRRLALGLPLSVALAGGVLLAAGLTLGLAVGGGVLLPGAPLGLRGGREVEVPLTVKKFAFSPPRISVQAGDRVTFRIRSLDITHGFAVEGTGMTATILPGREVRVTVPAGHAGKIRFRCSVICGPLHPFMVGEIVVRPNLWPLWGAGLALVVGLLAAGRPARPGKGADLLRWRPLRWLLTRRPFQFALIVPNLFAFTLIVLAGLVGTATGAMNFATIFVWLAWWGLLVLLLIPLGGRIWCAMCPIPAPGEWLARRAIVERTQRAFGLGWAWPRPLQNLWPAFVGLLLLVLFGLIITTRPLVTALLLLGLALVALVAHLLFERRVFCRYLCPVGGLLGVYSVTAPLELRARDLDVCRACRGKACFRGGDGYPCPTFEFPGGGLARNTYCILCTECLKACPYDNLALRLRPFGADLLARRGRRADEAWIALLLLGTALAHSVIKLGPWGWIKSWANLEGTTEFLLYAALFVGGVLVALPALHLLAAWLSRAVAGARVRLGRLFVDYAYALIPLSLAAWMAFTLAVLLPNLSYIPRVLSDPFGWGWDLFGTRETTWAWVPLGLLPWAQLVLLLVGLWGSIRTAHGIVEGALGEAKAGRGLVPLASFLVAIASGFLSLYLG